MLKLSKSELKPKLLAYLRQIEVTHESIIVMNHGKPIAKIIPYTEPEEDPLNAFAGSILHYEDPVEPVALEEWEVLKE